MRKEFEEKLKSDKALTIIAGELWNCHTTIIKELLDEIEKALEETDLVCWEKLDEIRKRYDSH